MQMKKRLVYHRNVIGHEINESLQYHGEDVLDREVYCRKLHRIVEPLQKECESCLFYAGWDHGNGHICKWEDIVEEEYHIPHVDRYKEYERVDILIKKGVLESMEDNPILRVKNLCYDKNKWIYEQSSDFKNRFLLGTRGNKTLICCGVNPSTASPEDLDPTMKRVDSFAKANGYDSYIMINLYPMRATDPKHMHDKMDEEIVSKNLQIIEDVLAVGNCDVWAAWGEIIKTSKKEYLKKCLEEIVRIADKYQVTWYTIGQETKDGHPRHPLYLKEDSCKKTFDVHTYLKRLG